MAAGQLHGEASPNHMSPFKIEAFLCWSQKSKRRAPAGLNDSKHPCCELPIRATEQGTGGGSRRRAVPRRGTGQQGLEREEMSSANDPGSRKRPLSPKWELPPRPSAGFQSSEKPATLSALPSDLQVCEWINGCFFKLLNVWWFVVQQQKTNADAKFSISNRVVRVKWSDFKLKSEMWGVLFWFFIIKLARGIKKLTNQEWESFLFWAQAGGERKRGWEGRETEGGREWEKETEKFIPKFQQNQ